MNKQQDNILVSVWMITYNHEKYIADAIKSVLAQKGSFTIELNIGVDNSTDKTAEIVSEFEKQYPNIIKAKYYSTNIGMMANMIETMQRCKGKYVALLEGDDYWTYENKLQEQVNFLENNQDFSFCFHNAEVVYENDRPSHLFSPLENIEYQAPQIIKNWLIPTPSVVFRNFNIQWPAFAFNCVHGDILFFLLLFEKGKAFAFNKAWCAYRKNANSITNSNQANQNFIRKVLSQNKQMNRYFNLKYRKELHEHKVYWMKALLSNYKKKKQLIRLFIYGALFILINLTHRIPVFFNGKRDCTLNSVHN
jgi:glycosyltransferase involved in cell wall biosynthesis